eukprot:6205245-Pleurochrysis_carterae.AAC.2
MHGHMLRNARPTSAYWRLHLPCSRAYVAFMFANSSNLAFACDFPAEDVWDTLLQRIHLHSPWSTWSNSRSTLVSGLRLQGLTYRADAASSADFGRSVPIWSAAMRVHALSDAFWLRRCGISLPLGCFLLVSTSASACWACLPWRSVLRGQCFHSFAEAKYACSLGGNHISGSRCQVTQAKPAACALT